METTSMRAGKGKVLCVDDDADILTMLDALLTSNGYETVLGHDGEEALNLFRKHKSDLVAVVLDLRMPKKDGLQAAKDIRRESADIPLIALSAYLSGRDSQDLMKQCDAAGFNAYTTKPFAMEPFLNMLAESVRGRARDHNKK